MASPFSIFRKHQRVSLAAITFLAMIAFVFIGPLAKSGNRSGADPEQKVLAKWKYGDITKAEVDRQLQMNALLNRFFNAAFAEKTGMQYPVSNINEKDPNQALTVMVLAKKAELMGVALSNDTISNTIDDTLLQFTGGTKMTPNEKDALFEKVTGRRVSRDDFFNAMRTQEMSRHRREALAGR